MGYLLRMSAEIRDWLIDLRVSDPPAARCVGEALTALFGEGDSLGPPIVVSLAGSAERADPREALDVSYQYRLEQLQIVRRATADAATLVLEGHAEIAELDSEHEALGDRQRRAADEGETELARQAEAELASVRHRLSELRQLLPGVVESERKLAERSMRAQARLDAFRTRKETLKARYTAARTEIAVDQAMRAAEQDAGGPGTSTGEADESDVRIAVATGKLREVEGEIERELRSSDPEQGPAGLRPEPGLLELRPGAPGDSDVRILFAVEPAGTALLIAVLEGRDTVRDARTDAVRLASEVLRQVRAGGDPEAAACAFDDTAAFLDGFFPGEADEVAIGAASFIARNRARTLAEQRASLGLTQSQVAERMDVRQERVSAIERAEPGATEVRTLAAYVEALGGRLEIIADFGGDRVVLR